MTLDLRYEEARKRVAELRGFYIHLTLYFVVNTGLFLLDLFQGGGWWFMWPALGWGIGLIAHAIAYFFESGTWARRWEERKVDQFVRDGDEGGMNPAR